MVGNGLASLGALTRIILLIFFASCVVTVLFQIAALISPDLIFATGGVVIVGIGGAGVVMTLSFVVSVILVAVWVHAAHKNLHDSGLGGLNYEPAWATASLFIPFVNLYVPFASTRELVNRSHGESDWHAAIEAGDVTSWTAFNWAALVMFSVILGYMFVDSIQFVHVIMPLWGWLGLGILFYIFLAGSAWYFAQIVTKVTAAQVNGLHQSQGEVFA